MLVSVAFPIYFILNCFPVVYVEGCRKWPLFGNDGCAKYLPFSAKHFMQSKHALHYSIRKWKSVDCLPIFFLKSYLKTPTKWVCAQRRFRSVWSESSMSARRKLWSWATHLAYSENSDQTGWMPRLTWVFAGGTVTLLVLSYRGSHLHMLYL